MTVNLDSGLSGLGTLYHEYTHYLMSGQEWASYPIWLREGWAELLSTIRVSEDRVAVGLPPFDHFPNKLLLGDQSELDELIGAPQELTRKLFGVDVEKIVNARSVPEDVDRFYWGSFALLHYLQFGRETRYSFAEDMKQYLGDLAAGRENDVAFERAFGVTPGAMSEEVSEYVIVDGFPNFEIPVEHFGFDAQIPAVEPAPMGEIGSQLGWFLLLRDLAKEAGRYFTAALELDPDSARAHCGLSEVATRRGAWEAASAQLNRCLSLEPDSALGQLDAANHLMARLEAEQGDRDRLLADARGHLERCIELAPNLPEVHFALGRLSLLGSEKGEQAVQALERASELAPTHPGARFLLAQAYARDGRTQAAISALRHVTEFAHPGPGLDAARELLAELSDPEPGAGSGP